MSTTNTKRFDLEELKLLDRNENGWLVRRHDGAWVALFQSESDARRFVAAEAMERTLKRIVSGEISNKVLDGYGPLSDQDKGAYGYPEVIAAIVSEANAALPADEGKP